MNMAFLVQYLQNVNLQEVPIKSRSNAANVWKVP